MTESPTKQLRDIAYLELQMAELDALIAELERMENNNAS